MVGAGLGLLPPPEEARGLVEPEGACPCVCAGTDCAGADAGAGIAGDTCLERLRRASTRAAAAMSTVAAARMVL